jgi:transposase
VLEWEPGGFRVEVTERRKYACRACQSGVVMGPGPERVLEQAMPGAGLLAELVVRKIKDHCPLERQSRIFSERFGVPLSASTLGEWMAGSAEVLAPVARRIREQALSRTHLSTDDTPVRVLDPGHPKGVKRGHLWALCSDGPEVAFEYTPDWNGEPICQLLAGYGHTLQSDGYAGLDTLYKKESGPVRAGCLAHARRKFVVALDAGDLRAAVPLRLIQKVYALERQATQAGCDAAERLRRRQQHSAPLMTQLRQQAEALGAQAPPKTPLGRAITYLLRQWEPLTVFLRDGELRPDNNHTERQLRPVALGRKNWLFAGSDEGARRLAVLYTVVGSCEAAGIRDPWQYIRDVLTKLSRGWPQSRLDELLPLRWAAANRND